MAGPDLGVPMASTASSSPIPAMMEPAAAAVAGVVSGCCSRGRASRPLRCRARESGSSEGAVAMAAMAATVATASPSFRRSSPGARSWKTVSTEAAVVVVEVAAAAVWASSSARNSPLGRSLRHRSRWRKPLSFVAATAAVAAMPGAAAKRTRLSFAATGTARAAAAAVAATVARQSRHGSQATPFSLPRRLQAEQAAMAERGAMAGSADMVAGAGPASAISPP